MKGLKNNLKFVWQYVKDDKMKLIIFVLTNIFYIAFGIVTPVLSAKAIVALTTNEYIQIITVGIAILVANLLMDVVSFLMRRLTIKIYRNTLSRIEIDLGSNVLKLENACLDDKGSGLFIQRLTNDTSKMSSVFNQIIEVLSYIIKDIGILIAMFFINKIVFIYVLITLIILSILEKVRTDNRKKDDKEARKYEEKVSGFVGELVRGARDIKMLNSEKDFIKELDFRIKEANDKRYIMNRNNTKYNICIWSIDDLTNFILIILLVILMKQNILIAANALILYNYSSSTRGIYRLLGQFLEQMKDFNLSTERVKEILDDDKFTKEKFGTKHLNKIEGNFEFKDVTFSYNDKKVLDKLNFKINANETVAFVGKSGAGKTTIFNLLCKMYDINNGSITIDGIDIKELDRESIRGNITIISQDPYIFNMSIKDNLKLVKSNLTNKEMKEACKAACLDDYIESLPNKYDTVIGEGGVNLSGGQKQRLAIARALVQKTEIILFDEATSALDNETQAKISEAINNMKNEYTILIIAHRLSTIINADRILYIEDGQVKAEGTHKELLKKCSEYKKLYESEITKE